MAEKDNLIYEEDCIYLDREITEDFLWLDRNFNSFSMFLDFLLRCREDKNAVYETFGSMAYKYKKTEKEIKKAVFELRDNGFIEIYKSNMRGQIVIAPRKNEYVDFCGEEFYLDESKIMPTPYTNGRNEPGYEKFRRKVLKRDGYSCQLCGAVDNLEVHHKKLYANYPKLRTVVSNGITLCNSCHKNVHRKRVD